MMNTVKIICTTSMKLQFTYILAAVRHCAVGRREALRCWLPRGTAHLVTSGRCACGVRRGHELPSASSPEYSTK